MSRPARVRVTSPRMGSAHRPDPSPLGRDLTEGTRLGEVYMRSLVRAQLRHAVAVLLPAGLVLGSLPVLFATRPELNDVRLLTVPLPWLLLGVGVYPLILLAAWWHRRLAESTEEAFTELLEQTARAAATDADRAATDADRATADRAAADRAVADPGAPERR